MMKDKDITGELVAEMQKGLLQWYAFVPHKKVLYIGSSEDVLVSVLDQADLAVECVLLDTILCPDWSAGRKQAFDYIVLIADLERVECPAKYLLVLRDLLCDDGTMLLGMNNRLGIRYFCGDRDLYTQRSFDGIENYRYAYNRHNDVFQGRMYSQEEMGRLLVESGWEKTKFFSVLTDLQNPSFLFADGYQPNENLAVRVFPTYHSPDTVFLEEEGLYDTLLRNGMFHKMANAYLIECSPSGKFSDVEQVTCSIDRGRTDALLTLVHRSGIVEKRAPYPEGTARLHALLQHGRDLSARGIKVVDAELQDGIYVMPFIHAESGQFYLQRLLQEDVKKFLRAMDHFRDLILQSSEHAREDVQDGQGVLLRKAYLDMVPLNSFFANGTFMFYDQEFCKENYPANVILMRTIMSVYSGNAALQKNLPLDRLLRRYDLLVYKDTWDRMAWEFLNILRNEKILRSYHEAHRRNMDLLNANRQRINFSAEDYQRLFIDVFAGIEGCKLILFGAGAFAKKFLELYRQDYPVYAIIDNEESRWGQTLGDIKIQSPAFLQTLSPKTYKVLICIKGYLSVVHQLRAMGIRNYAIFDAHRDYPRKRKPIRQNLTTALPAAPKKYHTGYIAGVFDLFHVGHLNLLRRAKEQCDYLIVGVVNDQGVRAYKKVEPVIPFEERLAMVRGCRYVDEAEEIPFHYGGTRDAWKLYHFDVQFSGSDYMHDPDWLAEKQFLERHGAAMVFFPYTEQTSSTKIKALLAKRLG